MKNRDKTRTTIIIIIMIVAVGALCLSISEFYSSIERTDELKMNKELQETNGVYGHIEIVRVRDCEYVLWHNGRGSDMEHYEGCDNPKHCNP